MKCFGATLLTLCQVICYTMCQKCPQECRCMWKDGKRAVDCTNSGIVGFPKDLQKSFGSIETNIQILYFTGNFLKILPSRIFQQLGMINLQKIYLQRCAIEEIADDSFYQVANLIEMDLSFNFLTWVPSAIFKDTPILRRLLLSHNPIQRLDNGSFDGLSHLTTLELSNCQIQSIDVDAFRGLHKLEYLKLDGNRLEIITKEVIRDLPPLHALDLHRNSWTCDCRVGEVRLWMVERNVPFSDPPRCERPPRLRGFFWDILDLNDLACPPEAESVQKELIVTERQDAILKCKIRASPEGIVRWIWRGRSIANLSLMSFGRQMYLIREIGNTEKTTLLTIFNVMLKDSGVYTCFTSNPAGNASSEITLRVLPLILHNSSLTAGEICAIIIGSLIVIVLTIALFLVIFHHRLKFPTREEKLLILPKPIANLFTFRYSAPFGRSSNNNTSQEKPNRVQESIKPITDVLEFSTDDQTDLSLTTESVIIEESRILRDQNDKMINSTSLESTNLNDVVMDSQHRQVYENTEQRPQKHEVVVAIDQVHHALSNTARDSPDEGLGDEREYDTETID